MGSGVASAGYDVAVHPVTTENVGSDGAQENRDAVSQFAQQLRDRAGLSVAELTQKTVFLSQMEDTNGDFKIGDGEMMKQAADQLYDRGELENHDHLLLAHQLEAEGLGNASKIPYTPSGASDFEVSVCTHLVDPVGDALAETIGIHELLHTPPGRFAHCHGRYWTNSDGDIYLVSPMAASYTFETSGSNSCDSEHCGTTFCATSGPHADETPDKFVGSVDFGDVDKHRCGKIPDSKGLESPYTGGNFVSDCPLHTKFMSKYVITKIQQKGEYDNWSDR